MSENLPDGPTPGHSSPDRAGGLGLLIPFSELVRRHGIRVDRVIHAGAHLGEEGADYAALGTREVLWIEANPDLLERLRANVAPYGHTVVQALLGAEAGREVQFNVSNFESMSSSVLELGTHRDAHPEVEYVAHQNHRLQTLDDVAQAHGFLGADFLNLDLQGYELECLKGGQRVLEQVNTVYAEVSVDHVYKDSALLPELDAWLNARGFEAREVLLYGSPLRVSPEFVGWGDCCFVRVDNPRPFHQVFPDEAAAWFAPATGPEVTEKAPVEDRLPVRITLQFGSSWQGRLAMALTRSELARRLPCAEIEEGTPGKRGSDLVVLGGDVHVDTDHLAAFMAPFTGSLIGGVAWQDVHLPAAAVENHSVVQVGVWPAIVTIGDAATGQRLRQLAPDLDADEVPDIGLLAARLTRDSIPGRRDAGAARGQHPRIALTDPDIQDDLAAALRQDPGLTVVAVNAAGADEVVAAVDAAEVVISRDTRLLAVAFSLGRPLVPLQSGASGRLQVTFGRGIEPPVEVGDILSGIRARRADRTLLPALQAELDAYFDRLATLAAESGWRRRREGEIAEPEGSRMDDADARAFADELNAHGTMARRVVEERHVVVIRDRELAAQRDGIAQLQALYEVTRDELAALRQTRTFRYTARLRAAYIRILTAIGRR